jgi:hypothetical protein
MVYYPFKITSELAGKLFDKDAREDDPIKRREIVFSLGEVVGGIIIVGSLAWYQAYRNFKRQLQEHEAKQQATYAKTEKIPGTNIVAPKGFDLKKVKTKANKALLSFPDKIPGARKIDKYLTPNANYCLVHIVQAHHGPKELKLNKETKAVQADIGSIITHLIDNKILNEFYQEGICPGPVPGTLGAIIHNKELEFRQKNGLLEKDIKVKKISPNYSVITLTPSVIKKYADAGYIYAQLQLDNKLTILPAEDAMTHLLCNLYNLKFQQVYDQSFEKRKEVGKKLILSNEERENVVLKRVAKKGKHLACVIYGGGHAWAGYQSFGKAYANEERTIELGDLVLDNIAEWNKKHRLEKFSLIEIYPTRYNHPRASK